MGKGRRAVRVFFNTYYEDSARRVIEAVRRLGYRVEVKRSNVVPELYYLDVHVGEEDLNEAYRRVSEAVTQAADDTVFGVKIYSVDASR